MILSIIPKEILEFKLLELDEYSLSVYKVIGVLALVTIARVLIWVLGRLMARRKNLDPGRKHSLMLISQYFIWVICIALGLEMIGVKITILLAGSAALLVGIGLGLQQLFNDLVSGVFILFEGTIEVGNVMELDGIVGRVKEINLRTSKLQTNDDIIIIVPNSKFVSERVINWSHNYDMTRFHVGVGVSYSSDVALVRKVLLDCLNNIKGVAQKPNPFVRFKNFGDSSLEFQLFFWSETPFDIENIKSDLRFRISSSFAENNITIPFPQRDIHIKTQKGTDILK